MAHYLNFLTSIDEFIKTSNFARRWSNRPFKYKSIHRANTLNCLWRCWPARVLHFSAGCKSCFLQRAKLDRHIHTNTVSRRLINQRKCYAYRSLQPGPGPALFTICHSRSLSTKSSAADGPEKPQKGFKKKKSCHKFLREVCAFSKWRTRGFGRVWR